MASDNCLYMLIEVAIPTFSRDMCTAYRCNWSAKGITLKMATQLTHLRSASTFHPKMHNCTENIILNIKMMQRYNIAVSLLLAVSENDESVIFKTHNTKFHISL